MLMIMFWKFQDACIILLKKDEILARFFFLFISYIFLFLTYFLFKFVSSVLTAVPVLYIHYVVESSHYVRSVLFHFTVETISGRLSHSPRSYSKRQSWK